MGARHLTRRRPPAGHPEGTDADNNADTIAMGRHGGQSLKIMDDVRTAVAVDLINSGHSIATVAEMMGVGFGTMQRAVVGKTDPSINSGRHMRKVPDDEVLRARRDFAAGRATIREIADRLGIAWPGAQKMIQGVSYKHVGEAVGVEASRRKPRTAESCTVDGCPFDAIARGLCNMHYDRLKATGTVGPAGRIRAKVTADMVRDIRAMRDNHATVPDIMSKHGVSRGCVAGILSGRTWGHLAD